MDLNLFGIPRFNLENRSIQRLPAKAYLAIALLLIKYDGFVRRATLASYLWEDRDTNLANANLRQLLAAIRRFEKQNSLEIIKADRNNIYLANSVVCDLDEFTSIKKLTTSEGLKRYVANYQRDFLQGLEDSSGDNLNKWILIQRQNFSNQFLQIAYKGALKIGGKDGEIALESLLLSHPYDEKLLQTLIISLTKNGDYIKAKRCFDMFAKRLSQDLNVNPTNKTITLVARLLPDLIPELHRKYSFLSRRNTSNIIFTGFENNPLREEAKVNNNPLPRLLILPPTSGASELPTYSHRLVDSLIEDITLSLSRMSNFVVLAPHTAKQFVKMEHVQMQPTLDVDFIISTRLMPNGSNLNQEEKRYIIKLTSVSSGEVLITEEIRLTSMGLYESYCDVIQSLVSRIGLKIDWSVLSDFRNTGFANAYIFYLIGKEKLNIGDLPNVRAARKAFKHAIKLAPDFYLAQQMLARTYHLEWYLLGRPECELLLKTKNIATRLIKTNPSLAGGYWEYGNSQLYLGDIGSALEITSVAISLAPNHSDIIAHKADILCHHGEHNMALKLIGKALELNPLPPDIYYWTAAGSKFFLRDYKGSLKIIYKTKPISPLCWRLTAACYAMLGNKRESKKYKELYLNEYPDFRVSVWPKMFSANSQNDIEHYTEALYLAGFN